MNDIPAENLPSSSSQDTQGPSETTQNQSQMPHSLSEILNVDPERNTAAPTSVPCTKEWHKAINPDLRTLLVYKLVQIIFPDFDSSMMADRRICNLVAYCEKVEADTYAKANSQSEYYQLLAERTYEIQKGLQEKFRKRQEQRKQGQTMEQPQANTSKSQTQHNLQ